MIGERVGNYVITHQLGEGGMGLVFQAEHPQIGKKVALKILHSELSNSPDVVTRFFHEAKAVNDIGHPNIVDILDFGQAPSAQGQLVYLVMELLTGQTLSTLLESEFITPERATHITMQVADALAASHDRGIVHRDLKPDNIMLVNRGRDPDSVKLLDFGIAKVTGSGSGSVSKTRTGMVMGTPTHMSPEQCEGRGNLDHRTDIYALGIVMYQMLTGTVPFTGAGYGEILVKQMTEPPRPPSQVRPGISAHLEAITLKALAKRPDDRFQSMKEIIAALSGGGAASHANATIVAADAAHMARTRVASVTGPQQPTHPNANPTTLSGSAGQMTAFAPAPMTPAPMTPAPGTMMTRKSKLPMLAGGVIALAVAAVVVVLATKKDEPTETAAAEQPAPEPAPAPAPEPTPAPAPAPTPAPAPAPTPPPPAAPTNIKLAVATEPKGAEVYFGDETKARCVTPCDFSEAKSDKSATLTLKLAGHGDETRTVKLDADARLDVELAPVKKTVARRDSKKSETKTESKTEPKTETKKTETKKAPVGDNTINPFDN